jgi:hypothetical protein
MTVSCPSWVYVWLWENFHVLLQLLLRYSNLQHVQPSCPRLGCEPRRVPWGHLYLALLKFWLLYCSLCNLELPGSLLSSLKISTVFDKIFKYEVLFTLAWIKWQKKLSKSPLYNLLFPWAEITALVLGLGLLFHWVCHLHYGSWGQWRYNEGHLWLSWMGTLSVGFPFYDQEAGAGRLGPQYSLHAVPAGGATMLSRNWVEERKASLLGHISLE